MPALHRLAPAPTTTGADEPLTRYQSTLSSYRHCSLLYRITDTAVCAFNVGADLFGADGITQCNQAPITNNGRRTSSSPTLFVDLPPPLAALRHPWYVFRIRPRTLAACRRVADLLTPNTCNSESMSHVLFDPPNPHRPHVLFPTPSDTCPLDSLARICSPPMLLVYPGAFPPSPSPYLPNPSTRAYCRETSSLEGTRLAKPRPQSTSNLPNPFLPPLLRPRNSHVDVQGVESFPTNTGAQHGPCNASQQRIGECSPLFSILRRSMLTNTCARSGHAH